VVAGALALPVARAEDPPESWADPTLEDTLFVARIIVRGHVIASQPGETEPRLAIERVIAGEGEPGKSIPLYGSEATPALDKLLAPLKRGDEGIFILRQAGEAGKARLELPTPSFGRFQVRSGIVAASVRDSFVRVEMKADAYEVFLKNAWARAKGGKADTAFLDSCRATLASLDPTGEESVAPAHVALEGLALGAEPKDAKLALRFFAMASFQARISAAGLLERAGGADGADGLLRLALNDTDPSVRSVAIAALAVVKPTPPQAAKELAARLLDMDAASTPMHVNVEDPRTNEWDGPLKAAFETLRALGAEDRATPAAIELLAKDDGDTLATACLHLARVKAKDRVAEIVAKMRPADYAYTKVNELLGDLLTELTGQDLGSDPAAWHAYVKSGK
jgi:hypothetical protein